MSFACTSEIGDPASLLMQVLKRPLLGHCLLLRMGQTVQAFVLFHLLLTDLVLVIPHQLNSTESLE